MKSVTNVTGVTYINVAGGASSPATATPSEEEMISCGNPLIGSRKGCGSLELSRGAEGTGSPLHHPFPDSAEILRISGRGICKEAIFSPGGQAPTPKKSAPGATNRNLRFRLVGREATCLPFGQATFPPRRSPASIGSREGSHPLELSRGCSGGDFGFRRSGLFFCGRCFRRHGAWGAPLPYTPLGDGCERAARPLALSAVGDERRFLDGQGRFCSLAFFIAVLAKDFVSDDAGVGRAAPLHPLG